MLTANDIAGLLPALVTPFRDDGSIDRETLQRLVAHVFDGGAKGVVPIGGTGEYTALSPLERCEVIETSVLAAKGRGPVIAGVLSPGYGDAIAAAKDFKMAGADAVMLLTPFYATGSQIGMIDYIRRFREELDLPIVLYEIPARTNVSLDPESIAGLAEEGTAIGIKFSNYDVPRFARLAGMVGGNFVLLGGEEPLAAYHLHMGARGAVFATANLFPRYWTEMLKIAAQGDFSATLKHQALCQPLLDAVFAETNPGPLKKAMEMIGLPVGEVRLPLRPPSAETVRLLKDALAPLEFSWGSVRA